MITKVGSYDINSYTPNFNGMRKISLKTEKVKEPVFRNPERGGVFQTVKDIVCEMFPVLDKSYRNMIKSSPKKAGKIYG